MEEKERGKTRRVRGEGRRGKGRKTPPSRNQSGYPSGHPKTEEAHQCLDSRRGNQRRA